MTGKRDDEDVADAIRYLLNRYRAEVLGEPVAFEEVGRPKRYTFADDVVGDWEARRTEAVRRAFEEGVNRDILPKTDAPDGVSFRFDRDDTTLRIDGEEVDADLKSFSVEVDHPIDPPSIEDMVGEVRRIRERRSFKRLFDEAATTLTVTEPATVDDFRDLVDRLRREGYGGAPTYDPSSWVDVTYDTSGTVFVCGVVVDDQLRDSRYGVDDGTGLSIDGVPVLKSKGAPDRKGVLVDTDALVPLDFPFTPPDPKDPRFEVRDPRGIAAYEVVDGGR